MIFLAALAGSPDHGFRQVPIELCDDYEVTELTPAVKAKVAHDFATMHALGVQDLRLGLSWTRIEVGKHQYDWAFWDYLVEQARQQHVTLRPYFCYTAEWAGDRTPEFWHHPPATPAAFADFVEVTARRYHGKVTHWELWNEPDNAAYWELPGKGVEESADRFAAMIRPAAERLRRVEPGASVMLGGMSDGDSAFFKRVMERHHLGDLVDTVNVHAYFRTWSDRPQEDLVPYLQGVQALVERTTGARKPLVVLDEFGHSSHRFGQARGAVFGVPLHFAHERTPAYQAEALFKDHTLALASGVPAHVAWYRIDDLPESQEVIGDNNNRYLGLLDTQGQPKPAYEAFAFFRQLFDQPTRPLDGRVQLQAGPGSAAQVHVLERQDGSLVVVGWLRDVRPGEVADRSGLANDTRRETVAVRVPGLVASQVERFEASGRRQPAGDVKLQGDTLSGIHLRGDRVFVAVLRG